MFPKFKRRVVKWSNLLKGQVPNNWIMSQELQQEEPPSIRTKVRQLIIKAGLALRRRISQLSNSEVQAIGVADKVFAFLDGASRDGSVGLFSGVVLALITLATTADILAGILSAIVFAIIFIWVVRFEWLLKRPVRFRVLALFVTGGVCWFGSVRVAELVKMQQAKLKTEKTTINSQSQISQSLTGVVPKEPEAKSSQEPTTEVQSENKTTRPKSQSSSGATEEAKSEKSPPAPITSMEVFSGDRYKPGSKVHGIPWRADLMDLWVSISNESGGDYKDFSLSIDGVSLEGAPEGVSIGFYEIAQVDGLTECRTQLHGDIRAVVPGATKFEPPGRPSDGVNLENTVVSVKADCSRFPHGSSVRFIVALMNVRNLPGPKFKPPAAGIEYRYTVNGERWGYRVPVGIRDMDNALAKQTWSNEELNRLGSKMVRGTAQGITGSFSIRERVRE